MASIFGIIDFNCSEYSRDFFSSVSEGKMSFWREGGECASVGMSAERGRIFSVRRGGETHIILFDGFIDEPDLLAQKIKSELGYSPFISDFESEILLWAYMLWGGDLPNRIDGEYSFAVYSYSEYGKNKYPSRLFLACDCLGASRFCYTLTEGGEFIFSSDVKKLLSYPSVRAEIDIYGVWQICYLSPAKIPSRTPFRDVYELEGGFCAYLDCRAASSRQLMKKRYWHISESKDSKNTYTEINGETVKPSVSTQPSYSEKVSISRDRLYSDFKKSASLGCVGRYDGADIRLFYSDFCCEDGFDGFDVSEELICEALGLNFELYAQNKYLNCFFPWIYDPYQRIELFTDDIFRLSEGFNFIYDNYNESLFGCRGLDGADIRLVRGRKCVCQSVKYIYPETIRLVRGIEKIVGRGIFPRISRREAERLYNNPVEYAQGKRGNELGEARELYRSVLPRKIKNPDYEVALRALCAELASQSGNKIFKFTDRDKLSALLCDTKVRDRRLLSAAEQIEWLCRVDIWLNEYEVDIKI